MKEKWGEKEKEVEKLGKTVELAVELQAKLGKMMEKTRESEGKVKEMTIELDRKTKNLEDLMAENKKNVDEIQKLSGKLQFESDKSEKLQLELNLKSSYSSFSRLFEFETRLKDLEQSKFQSEQSISQLTAEKNQLTERLTVVLESSKGNEALCQTLKE